MPQSHVVPEFEKRWRAPDISPDAHPQGVGNLAYTYAQGRSVQFPAGNARHFSITKAAFDSCPYPWEGLGPRVRAAKAGQGLGPLGTT